MINVAADVDSCTFLITINNSININNYIIDICIIRSGSPVIISSLGGYLWDCR